MSQAGSRPITTGDIECHYVTFYITGSYALIDVAHGHCKITTREGD